MKRIIPLLSLILTVSSSAWAGQVLIVGEDHLSTSHKTAEFLLWQQYYGQGWRHLVLETGSPTAYLLNQWMKAKDDKLLDLVYSNLNHTAAGKNPAYKTFLQEVKATCPETIFAGIDVEHQQASTGQEALKYLEAHGGTAEQKALLLHGLGQGQQYLALQSQGLEDKAKAYREEQLTANMVTLRERLGEADLMVILGYLHLEPQIADGLSTVTARLRSLWGNDLQTVWASQIQMPEEQVVLSWDGQKTTAQRYPTTPVPSLFGGQAKRTFYSLADATPHGELPYGPDELTAHNFPYPLQPNTMHLIRYDMHGFSFFVAYFSADSQTSRGLVPTGLDSYDDAKSPCGAKLPMKNYGSYFDKINGTYLVVTLWKIDGNPKALTSQTFPWPAPLPEGSWLVQTLPLEGGSSQWYLPQ